MLAAGHDVYMVGGAIRDLIAGMSSNDFDLAVNAGPEEIKRVFADAKFHSVGKMSFGYIVTDGEVIDIAPLYNIPAEYKGLPGIPEFDATQLETDSARNDSFRRDLTINALFYDMKTDEILDYHGGLWDLREGVLDTLTDADAALLYTPSAAIRALRFKARYGYPLSGRLESALRANEIQVRIIPDYYYRELEG